MLSSSGGPTYPRRRRSGGGSSGSIGSVGKVVGSIVSSQSKGGSALGKVGSVVGSVSGAVAPPPPSSSSSSPSSSSSSRGSSQQRQALIAARQQRQAQRQAQQQQRAFQQALASIPQIGNSHQVAPLVVAAAKKYNLPPSALMGQLQQESNFNPASTSSAGAQGESQFISSTGQHYGVQPGTSPTAIKSQIYGQAHYIADLVRSTGSLSAALNSYYGSSAPYNGSQSYAQQVLAKAQAYAPLDRVSGKGKIKAGPYVSPFSKSSSYAQSRTDEGVDYTGSGRIVSPAKAKYLGVGQGPGWASGGGGGTGYGVVEKFLKGPKKGTKTFLYEGIAPAGPKLTPGQTIRKGQTVAKFVPGGSIETGLSNRSGAPLAQPTYSEGQVTKPGVQYQRFLSRLGAASRPGSSVPASGGTGVQAVGSLSGSTAATSVRGRLMSAASRAGVPHRKHHKLSPAEQARARLVRQLQAQLRKGMPPPRKPLPPRKLAFQTYAQYAKNLPSDLKSL